MKVFLGTYQQYREWCRDEFSLPVRQVEVERLAIHGRSASALRGHRGPLTPVMPARDWWGRGLHPQHVMDVMDEIAMINAVAGVNRWTVEVAGAPSR